MSLNTLGSLVNNPTPYKSSSPSLGSFVRPQPLQGYTSGPNQNMSPAPNQSVAAPAIPGLSGGTPLQGGHIPTPATPLKKTTTTTPDGTSTTHEYHAPTTPGVLPTDTKSTIASSTSDTADLTPASVARSQFAAGQLGSDEEKRIRDSLQQAGVFLGNKGAAPLGGFNIGGAGQAFQQAQAGLLNSLVQSANPQLTDIQSQRNAALSAAQGVQGAVSPQYGVQPGTLVGQPLQPGGGIDQNYLGGIEAPANLASVDIFRRQINTTQKSVDILNNITSQLIPNMGTVGFNPANTPIGNQTFQQYFANSNPAASAGIQAGLGEIKNQISNVIASATGLTPTGVTAVADTYDISKLSPQQLNDFLLYINQFAQDNIAGTQKSIDRIRAGGKAGETPTVLPTPPKNSTGSAALGTGATAAQGLINKVLSEVSSAASGAVGGLAAKVLL